MSPGDLEAARIVENGATLPLGVRLPGTYLPGVLIAGSYGTGDDRAFWVARPHQRVLEMTLRGHTYRRVVVDVDDPAAVLAAIEHRWPGVSSARVGVR